MFNAGNKGELMLRKLETARVGSAAKPVPGSASISESTRQAGVQRILQALRKSAAVQGAAESQLVAAARVTLLELFHRLGTTVYCLGTQSAFFPCMPHTAIPTSRGYIQTLPYCYVTDVGRLFR